MKAVTNVNFDNTFWAALLSCDDFVIGMKTVDSAIEIPLSSMGKFIFLGAE
jgi:hypothetical protein